MSADGQRKPAPERRGLYGRLHAWLAHPKADRVVLWLGFVLLLPSLDTGLATDDYLHTIMLDRPAPIAGFQRAPLDLFRFADARFSPALIQEGIFAWWDDPTARIAFMRPLTAATHWLDHELWRNVGWLRHLHSALWALWLLFGVRALYREWLSDRFLASLAFALYALDDARGWLVSWVAARNAVIGTAFSVWALVVHLRQRRGQFPAGSWLAPLLLAFGLLGSEGAAAVGCYMLGHTLFEEQGPLVRRLLRLWPYALVLVLWRVPYHAYQFGVIGSGLYADPTQEPLRFLQMLVENAPILLGSQFGAMWSDAWLFLFFAPRLQIVVWLLTLAYVAAVLYAVWPALGRRPELRSLAFGSVLAVLPASPTFIADRLLTWISLGGSVVCALLIAPLLQRAPSPRPRWAPIGVLLLVLHLIGVPFLPSRARGTLVMRDFIDRADAGIPHDESIRDKTLVFLNPPHLPFASYPPIERAAQGLPRPHALHTLATSTTALSVERIDAHTLRLAPRGGFLQNPSSRLLRSELRPFHAGQEIQQGDLRVRVRAVSADGRPLEVDVRFERPLEDPEYVWRQWVGSAAVPIALPEVGQSVQLPAADYGEAMFGVRFPFPIQR
ncbi:MAG TPA: hypothetical protein VJR89_40465 [Polyangiales bacterium]|nr:hypothetical protein [Polyangiales bacterium]